MARSPSWTTCSSADELSRLEDEDRCRQAAQIGERVAIDDEQIRTLADLDGPDLLGQNPEILQQLTVSIS